MTAKTDPNLVTSDKIDAKPEEALTPAQVEALDRDGDGKAGGSLPKAKPGEVTKKGAPPPETTGGPRADGLCVVRITKTGHGQVHDGEGSRYDWNDEVILPLPVGKALEGRSYGEIIG